MDFTSSDDSTAGQIIFDASQLTILDIQPTYVYRIFLLASAEHSWLCRMAFCYRAISFITVFYIEFCISNDLSYTDRYYRLRQFVIFFWVLRRIILFRHVCFGFVDNWKAGCRRRFGSRHD